MAREGAERLAGGGVPNLDGIVRARTGQRPTIRAPRDSEDLPCVAGEDEGFRNGQGIGLVGSIPSEGPDSHGPVHAAAGERTPVEAPGNRVDGSEVVAQRRDQ